MKKFYIGAVIVLALLVAPAFSQASTLSELQALIASLTAQLNALHGQQNTSTSTPVIINPTATSSGMVSFVNRPTLALFYDNNRSESSLKAVANVRVIAGANDLLIQYLAISIADSAGHPVYTNGTNGVSFTGVSNTTMESISTPYGNTLSVWRVKAGTTATFKIARNENPQMMFSGIYTASLGEVGIANKAGEVVYGQLAYENTKSLPVTIVGEKSPYISSFVSQNNNIVLYGERFDSATKVYVGGVYKGQLTSVSYAKGVSTYQGSFPNSWLPVSYKGGCSVAGNIQIESSRYGKSNNFWVYKDCESTGTSTNVVSLVASPHTVAQPSTIGFDYVVTSKTPFDKVVYHTICNDSEIAMSAPGGLLCNEDTVINSNGTQYSYSVDFRSLDGKDHTFGMSVSAYSKGVLIGSDKDAITVFGTPIVSPTSPTVLYPNGGEIIALTNAILITFKPVIGSMISVNLLDSSGHAYQLATVMGDPTDKQAINVNASVIKNYGLGDGKYKIEACSKLGCDTSDNYFTITTSIPVPVPIQLPSLSISPTSVSSGKQVIFNYVVPSNATSMKLSVSCPAGVSVTNGGGNICNLYPISWTGSFPTASVMTVTNNSSVAQIVKANLSATYYPDGSTGGTVGQFEILPASNSQPSITVQAPNGGEVFNGVGSKISGSFTTTLPVGTRYEVSLISPPIASSQTYDRIVFNGSVEATDRQVFAFVIPSNVLSGNTYKVRVNTAEDCGASVACIQDQSDNYFTIGVPVTPPVVSTGTVPVTPTTPTKTCYIQGKSILGTVSWVKSSCDGHDYLNTPSSLKKEVLGMSQTEQLSSIAASIQAIKDILGSW